MANITVIAAEIAALEETMSALTQSASDSASGADEMWHLVAGILVFFMQAGFAVLEAGAIRSKNAINILFKNMLDAAISCMFFWVIGYAFAYGDTQGGFIGRTNFGLSKDDFINNENYHTFFFQWTFAATAATITSGSVAERCKLEAYFIYSAVISGFIYPVIVHWCWGEGWLSAFGSDVDDYLFYGDESNNYIDFAGSGVVHMTGGICGLVAAIVLGPRIGRFNPDGSINEIPGHNVTLMLLGIFILWVGWYGFNPGSTLCIVGDCSDLASKVAVTTTIAAAFSCLTAVVFQTVMGQTYDISLVGNAVLAGLVSVTAPCAVIDPWGAMIIGMIGFFVYYYSSEGLKFLNIDDPLDASPIHGACGAWGMLAVGIFGNDPNAAFAGYVGSANGNDPFKSGEQFGVQLVALLTMSAWTFVMAAILFYGIHATIGLRVDPAVELRGMDLSEHGAQAYHLEITETGEKVVVKNEE